MRSEIENRGTCTESLELVFPYRPEPQRIGCPSKKEGTRRFYDCCGAEEDVVQGSRRHSCRDLERS